MFNVQVLEIKSNRIRKATTINRVKSNQEQFRLRNNKFKCITAGWTVGK